MREVTGLSYEQWIDYVFERPPEIWWGWPTARGDRPPRYRPEPAVIATYIAQLFEDVRPVLARFNAEQIGNGFICIGHYFLERALATGSSHAQQKRWIRAVCPLVRELRTAGDPHGSADTILRGAFTRAACSPWYTHLRPAVLETLQALLTLDCEKAQLRALWVLGEIRPFAPREVCEIASAYRAAHPVMTEDCAEAVAGALSEPPPGRPLTFDEWMTYVFDRPLPRRRTRRSADWWFQDDSTGQPLDWWESQPLLVAEYLARLFEQPELLLARFTAAQVNQGFWYLLSGGRQWAVALDDRVPADRQQRWLRAVYLVFRDLFTRQCSISFGHLSNAGPQRPKPLNCACYMWWHMGDLYAVAGSVWYPHLVEPVLDVLERTLALDSPACQEAGLHGLGHVQEYHPERVAAIIDRYLPDVHPGLRAYAQGARAGHVQ